MFALHDCMTVPALACANLEVGAWKPADPLHSCAALEHHSAVANQQPYGCVSNSISNSYICHK